MKRITPTNLRSLFPKQVPKDIVMLVDEYIFNDIREVIKKTIYEHITLVINPDLIPEKYFTEKVTQGFVEKVGTSFKDFLDNYESKIKIKGSNILHDVCNDILPSFCSVRNEYMFQELDCAIYDFIQITLTKMGIEENYFSKGICSMIYDYLDSLKI